MTVPLKPPRGLFIPSWLLFDAEMPDSLKVTLFQLMALTWASSTHTTPLLTYGMIQELTGKAHRTLWGHISELRADHAALRLQYAERGTFMITLADRFFPSAPGWKEDRPLQYLARKDLRRAVKEEELIQEQEEEYSIPPLLVSVNSVNVAEICDETAENCDEPAENCDEPAEGESQRAVYPKRKPARRAPARGPARELPEEVKEALLEAGVFPTLLGEIAGSGYSDDDLLAMLDWAAEDSPDHAAQCFMGRLRHGARPPERFSAPVCPSCGVRGGHAEGCYKKYAE